MTSAALKPACGHSNIIHGCALRELRRACHPSTGAKSGAYVNNFIASTWSSSGGCPTELVDRRRRHVISAAMYVQLSEASKDDSPPIQDHLWWRMLHFAGFYVGGITFIIGTAMYYDPDMSLEESNLAAALYIIGSCGFLTVDVMEFFTPDFTWYPLRANLALNACGSILYVLGSIGFLPAIMNSSNQLGAWGFILGSALIGVGEIWKIARIATPASPLEQADGEADAYPMTLQAAGKGGTDGRHAQGTPCLPSLWYVCSSADVFTAAGIEVGAFIGSWSFFVGSAMFDKSVAPLQWYDDILSLWMAGSIGFTMGALFMAYRHFWLKLS